MVLVETLDQRVLLGPRVPLLSHMACEGAADPCWTPQKVAWRR